MLVEKLNNGYVKIIKPESSHYIIVKARDAVFIANDIKMILGMG